MTWKKIKCPLEEKDISWGQCLRCTDAEKHPDCPILAVRQFARSRDYVPNVYHVTELVHPRRSYFARTVDIARGWDDDNYVSFLIGRATHQAIQSNFPPQVCEIRVERNWGEFKVTGSADIVANGVLYEFKTYANLGPLLKRGKPEPDHLWQARAYYSLLCSLYPELARRIKKIKIIYFGKTRKGKAKQYKEFDIKPVDITNEIHERVKSLHDALKAGVPPAEKCPKWLCYYCDYANECKSAPEQTEKPKALKPMKVYIKEGVHRARGGQNPVWCVKFDESDANFWIKFKDGKKPWKERGILYVDWLPRFDQLLEIVKIAVAHNSDFDRRVILAVLEAIKEGKK